MNDHSASPAGPAGDAPPEARRGAADAARRRRAAARPPPLATRRDPAPGRAPPRRRRARSMPRGPRRSAAARAAHPARSRERTPHAAARSQPVAGFSPCRAPIPATASQGQRLAMTWSRNRAGSPLRPSLAARAGGRRRLVAVVVAHPFHLVGHVALVAALGREVEHAVGAHHHLDAAAEGRVGVEDLARVVLVEHADAGRLLAREAASCRSCSRPRRRRALRA